MPWRIPGSVRTSMPLNLTPMWLRICTTAAEKPHCGKTGVPFMNSTTGASLICWRMRSCKVGSILWVLGCGLSSILWDAGLQGKGVQLVAHPAAQGLVDQLVLLHPALAAERTGDDMRS